jgi:hypothetical protein
MDISVRVAFDEDAALRLLNWLAGENSRIFTEYDERAQRKGGEYLPGLYESHIRYEREDEEIWGDYLNTLIDGVEDCDALSAIRAGELLARGWRALKPRDPNDPVRYPGDGGYDAAQRSRPQSVRAEVILKTSSERHRPGLYHCIVRYWVDGREYRDDPSARLGMLGDSAEARQGLAGGTKMKTNIGTQCSEPSATIVSRIGVVYEGPRGKGMIVAAEYPNDAEAIVKATLMHQGRPAKIVVSNVTRLPWCANGIQLWDVLFTPGEEVALSGACPEARPKLRGLVGKVVNGPRGIGMVLAAADSASAQAQFATNLAQYGVDASTIVVSAVEQIPMCVDGVPLWDVRFTPPEGVPVEEARSGGGSGGAGKTSMQNKMANTVLRGALGGIYDFDLDDDFGSCLGCTEADEVMAEAFAGAGSDTTVGGRYDDEGDITWFPYDPEEIDEIEDDDFEESGTSFYGVNPHSEAMSTAFGGPPKRSTATTTKANGQTITLNKALDGGKKGGRKVVQVWTAWKDGSYEEAGRRAEDYTVRALNKKGMGVEGTYKVSGIMVPGPGVALPGAPLTVPAKDSSGYTPITTIVYVTKNQADLNAEAAQAQADAEAKAKAAEQAAKAADAAVKEVKTLNLRKNIPAPLLKAKMADAQKKAAEAAAASAAASAVAVAAASTAATAATAAVPQTSLTEVQAQQAAAYQEYLTQQAAKYQAAQEEAYNYLQAQQRGAYEAQGYYPAEDQQAYADEYSDDYYDEEGWPTGDDQYAESFWQSSGDEGWDQASW